MDHGAPHGVDMPEMFDDLADALIRHVDVRCTRVVYVLPTSIIRRVPVPPAARVVRC